MQSTKTNLKAFSLVELMVVIAIIGILSAVAVPSYKSYIIKAKVIELASIAESIHARAAQAYNEGTSTTSLTAIGFSTNTLTTANISGVTIVAGVTAATCTVNGTSYGAPFASIAVSGNVSSTGLNLSGSIALLRAGCISGDVISWTCGYKAGTGTGLTTAGNEVYLPSNCTGKTWNAWATFP